MKSRWRGAICLVILGLLCAGLANARELRVAYDAGPPTLDIQEQLSTPVLQLAHLSFDPLVRWTRDLRFEPRLATRYERIDPQTVRFSLRRDVRFHSGNRMTAKDFDFTFKRLKKSRDYQAVLARFSMLRVVDDYTIDLISDGPDPLALHGASYLFALDSAFYSGTDDSGRDKSLIIKNGDSFAAANLSGTGPFRVVRHDSTGRTELERFTDYWDDSSPGNLNRIEWFAISNEQARIEALQNGEVDFIGPVSPERFTQIRNHTELGLVTLPGHRIVLLQMNQQRREEFRDQRVRMAIVHAIDNQRIAREVMGNFATAAAQLSPPGYAGHKRSLQPRFNLALATQLMRDAGYANGFSITLKAPQGRYDNDAKIARTVADMLASINIRVELEILPKIRYWPLFDQRAADVMMIGWHSDTEDSASLFEYLAMTPDSATLVGAYNSGNYSSEYVDAMTRKAGRETDPDKRAELLQSIEARLFQDAAFVPLHWQKITWAASRDLPIESVLNGMNLPYLGDLVVP